MRQCDNVGFEVLVAGRGVDGAVEGDEDFKVFCGFEGEAGGGDHLVGGAVHLAAFGESFPEWIDGIQDLAFDRVMRADVFDDHQFATGFEPFFKLFECLGGIGYRAKHQGANHRIQGLWLYQLFHFIVSTAYFVEGDFIGEHQTFAPSSCLGHHVRRGFNPGNFSFVAVMLKIDTGANTDLQDPTLEI